MRAENEANKAAIDALVVQIGEVIDRNSEATQREIVMACCSSSPLWWDRSTAVTAARWRHERSGKLCRS
jgi:hypothetical protein